MQKCYYMSSYSTGLRLWCAEGVDRSRAGFIKISNIFGGSHSTALSQHTGWGIFILLAYSMATMTIESNDI